MKGFFYNVGGWKNDLGFLQNKKFVKNEKMVNLVFFYILQLPQTVISNSEKLNHPSSYTPLTGGQVCGRGGGEGGSGKFAVDSGPWWTLGRG